MKGERAVKDRKYYVSHKEKIAANKKAYYASHKEDLLNYGKSYREAHKEKTAVYHTAWQRKRLGITAEIYNEMLTAQGGVCAICRRPPNGRSLDTDHDHETGKVRGLLCSTCNKSLGIVEAFAPQAIAYLDRVVSLNHLKIWEQVTTGN